MYLLDQFPLPLPLFVETNDWIYRRQSTKRWYFFKLFLVHFIQVEFWLTEPSVAECMRHFIVQVQWVC